MNWSLGLGALSLAIWMVGTFIVPVRAGWIHLFLARGHDLAHPEGCDGTPRVVA